MGIKFDEHTAKKLDALYQSEDAQKRRKMVLKALKLQTGERVLDIGTGLGHLAVEMAEEVGPDGAVIGVDLNLPMLEVARQKCLKYPWVAFKTGNATQLPVEDHSFDVAVSVQVYEYIEDTAQVLKEMYRVLKPGGRAVVVASDWRSTIWYSADPERMSKVLTAWEEHCVYSDLPRTLRPKLMEAGFFNHSQSIIQQFNTRFNADAYSYHILQVIKSFVAGRNGVSAEEAAAWAEELLQLGEKDQYFFCLNQFLFLGTK